MDINDPEGRRIEIPRDLLFMSPELWGAGARLPAVPGDGQVIVSDRGPDAPPGQRYAVLGFDSDTTERYWRTRPKDERKRLLKAARKLRCSGPPETDTGTGEPADGWVSS